MSKSILTQARLRDVLSYDAETGVFMWRKPNKLSLAVVEAGTITEPRGATRYRRLNIDGKLYYAHRLAWFYVHGEWPAHVVDHVNRNGLDNRIGNLRIARQVENAANQKRRSDNASGYRGVSWCSSTQKWRAQLQHNKRSVNIGRFETKEAAQAAYLAAAKNAFGDYLLVEA